MGSPHPAVRETPLPATGEAACSKEDPVQSEGNENKCTLFKKKDTRRVPLSSEQPLLSEEACVGCTFREEASMLTRA